MPTLEHVNITVSDIERSTDFYRRILDLEVRWRGDSITGQPSIHIGTDTGYLALYQTASPGGRVDDDAEALGQNHIGWLVDSATEYEAVQERLDEADLVHHEMIYPPGRRTYFFDPDGYEIELVLY